MQRNESFLVYGVTGLLAVILIVAVVFGDEGAATLPADGQGDQALALDEVVAFDPVRALRGVGDPVDDELGGELGGEAAAGAELESSEGQAAPAAGQSPAEMVPGAQAVDPQAVDPQAVDPQAVDPQAVPAAGKAGGVAALPATSDQLREGDLGVSERDGNYRWVTVRRGDTFSALVQHWCGGLEQLPLAEALNEDVDFDRLREGQRVLLPWVDDAALAAARKEVTIASRRIDSDTGQTYTVKAGDSLWNIAVQKTGGARGAPGYIEQILALNPGIEPDRLKAGQAIRLP